MSEKRTAADDLMEMLVEKRNIVLSVSIDDLDAAGEILEWMYAPDKPMKAELNSINWDQAIVPMDVATAALALMECHPFTLPPEGKQ